MLEKMILFPYWLTLKTRNFLYNKGIKKSCKAEVPTICVGNVTAGGTGKTPHVEMILRLLEESDEWGATNLAVLSRGYKRSSKGFQQVTREGSAKMFGDEPLQIKKKNLAVTVAVDKDRVEGADFLVHPEKLEKSRKGRHCWNRNYPPADIIVLDDAYQYRKLRADLDIVLIDYNRPVTKDKLLPFGTLRDLPQRIYDADVLIITKCPSDLDNWEKTSFVYSLGFTEYRTSECEGTNKKGRTQKVLFTCIRYDSPKKVYTTSDARFFYSKKLILFSGIAKNGPLVHYLSDYYKIHRIFSVPDHHRYTPSDIRQILSEVKKNPTAAVATTEKDAQRILDYVGMPQTLMERMFYTPISVEFLSEEEENVFRRTLGSLRVYPQL